LDSPAIRAIRVPRVLQAGARQWCQRPLSSTCVEACRSDLPGWAGPPNRVCHHRRQSLHQLGLATVALVAAGEGGAKGESQRPVEGEDTSSGDVGGKVLLPEEVPDRLPEMRQLFAQGARVEAFARLIGAVERGNHCQLAKGLRRARRVFGRLGGDEERTGERPLALSAHAFARLQIGGIAQPAPPVSENFRNCAFVGEAIGGFIHASACRKSPAALDSKLEIALSGSHRSGSCGRFRAVVPT